MIARCAAALLLFQITATTTDTPVVSAPQYLRYGRALAIPVHTSGQTCAVLDASVFAHAAGQSLDDLRLYASSATEVPFTLTESGTARAGDEPATVRNAGLRGEEIVFDLEMPNRPYTAVLLNLDAENFVATAKVSGSSGSGAAVQLGSFALFDLKSQHLSRSTTLPLQESTFRELHIALHIAPSPGTRRQAFTAAVIRGATVPPSREAQTLYTSVADVTSFTQRGRETVGVIHIPAHVPVERFSFVLAPSFHQDFLRTVNISARPDNAQDSASVETVSGNISRTTLSGASTGLVMDESVAKWSVDAVLGADLREGATVEIAVENGDDKPLPIREAKLQMRQRRICFDADPSTASYTLRYGDDALKPPVYDYARLFVPAASPAVATLGAEEKNAAFLQRRDMRPYSERHPEILWVALVGGVAALGTIALRSARKRR